MNDLVFRAMMFARKYHATQMRKYTGNPYVDHLAEVAGIAATSTNANGPIPLATAWLHDVVEDQDVPYNLLAHEFGALVAEGVMLLSDLETGNRAERKAATRARLAEAPGWIQTIKCADLISNTSSIVMHDPKFAPTYLAEKRALLEVMTRADPNLRNLAMEMADQ